MKKICCSLLILTLPFSLHAQEMTSHNVRTGQAAGYASRDATVLSMMGWGVGLAIAIGALCALVKNEGSSTSHSH